MNLLVCEDDAIRFYTTIIKPQEHTSSLIGLKLLARRKWMPTLVKESLVVNSCVVNATSPERFLDAIRNMTLNVRSEGINTSIGLIPQSALALYCNFVARDAKKTCVNLTTHIIDQLSDGKSLASILTGGIHKTVSIKPRVCMIDVDSKDVFHDEIKHFLWDNNIPVTAITETTGGFHVFVDKERLSKSQNKKLWTTWGEVKRDGKELTRIHRDAITPIPGTLHAGFQTKYTVF